MRRTFFYRIRSSISAPRGVPGLTTPFAVGRVTTLGYSIPLVPRLFQSHLITENSFALAWQGDYISDDSYGYRVEIARDSNFSILQQVIENRTFPIPPPAFFRVGIDSTITIKNLTPNTEYFCRVRAFNNAGVSVPSTTLSIKTLAKNAPFQASSVRTNSILLRGDFEKRRIYAGSTTLTIQGADSIILALEASTIRVDSANYSSRNYRCLDSTINDISEFYVFINPQDSLKKMPNFILGTSGYIPVVYPGGCWCSTTVRRYRRLIQTSNSTLWNAFDKRLSVAPNPATHTA